jgi:phospholipase A1
LIGKKTPPGAARRPRLRGAARRLGRIAARAALSLGMGGGAAAALAQANCVTIEDPGARLACYDQVAGRVTAAPLAPPGVAPTVKPVTAPATVRGAATQGLIELWDLNAERRGQDLEVRRHKPVYVLPVSATSRVNEAPFRGIAAATTLPGGGELIQPVEAKFQISLKARLLSDVLGSDTDLWMAYTQSSRWQVYDGATSRPFRETNYEPELMLAIRTPYELLGWQGRVATLALTHQSNGRSQLLSRSWNRVIADFGLERGAWTINLRPWWRLPEAEAADNNPGIVDFVGRGEVLLSHTRGGDVYTLQLRHSLRGGSRSRGSAQLEWATPLAGQLHAYVQLFSGYGDSLIDYNFRQTRLGLGFSLVEWR